MTVRLVAVFLGWTALATGLVHADNTTQQAPDQFRVKFETSAGDFVIEVTRKWAPIGADHFHRLIEEEFYKDARFFRVVPGFVVQFGINGDPQVQAKWREKTLSDEPVVVSNMRGFVTYAKSRAPNSRTTQLFISLRDNQRLDALGFAPFGEVIEGMDVVDRITAKYGEQAQQPRIQSQGNVYLKDRFPNMDYIKSAVIMKDTADGTVDKAEPVE